MIDLQGTARANGQCQQREGNGWITKERKGVGHHVPKCDFKKMCKSIKRERTAELCSEVESRLARSVSYSTFLGLRSQHILNFMINY